MEPSEAWEVPVVVFIVWTIVLAISTLIVLSCLRRETRRFSKRLQRAGGRDEVPGIDELDSMLAQFVAHRLGKGVLDRLAASFAPSKGGDEEEEIREKILAWFRHQVGELRSQGLPEKQIKRKLLAAIRCGLTKHPLDLRGSRRCLEAATLLLSLEKEGPVPRLSSTLPNNDKKGVREQSLTCPTLPCDWLAAKTLHLLSLVVSHPNTITFFAITLSVLLWLYDCLSDIVVIDAFWQFKLPLMFPTDSNGEESLTYLSYQTLTGDLYAPLLLLILLSSLLCSLLACSCSRLSSRWWIARELASPEKELEGGQDPEPTEALARYDFQLSQAVTASLPQFVLQFSAYMLTLYLLEELKGLAVDQNTVNLAQAKIDSFTFSSLWFSGLASALSLVVGQYTAFKVQHEHGLTLGQRVVYFFACLANTAAMLTTTLVFVMAILLPCATYVGRYHIMLLVILGAAVIGVATLVSVSLALAGLDTGMLSADRVVASVRSQALLTSFLRFSKSGGSGQWSSLMGATSVLGRVLSLLTVNLFLPPSQLLCHPFTRFYSTSPRSPALHHAIAKQLTIYNILYIVSSILLCVNHGNFNLTPATRNLLIAANVTGVPCIFLSLLILFRFYSTHDLWTSNGAHLVFLQDQATICSSEQDGPSRSFNETDVTMLESTKAQAEDELSNENFESYKEDYPDRIVEEESGLEAPEAESTTIAAAKDEAERNESTEADRMQLMAKHSKRILKKQSLRLKKAVVRNRLVDSTAADIASVQVFGRWVDVSD